MSRQTPTVGESDGVEQEILAVSEAWSKAIVANDAELIAQFMADDWIMVSERGISSKEHFLSFVRSGQLTHDSMDLAELGRISMYDDTAVLVGRVTNVAHFAHQTFNANEWTSDVFVRTGGEWKCVMTHITPVLESPATEEK
jgi:ketosteroid isomerase-like protein